MKGAARSHQFGRQFTGFTFGKRGRPLYARVYLKTHEAAADAPVRELWRARGYDRAAHGEHVFRVEYEVRGEFLRTLAADGAHLPSDPAPCSPRTWTSSGSTSPRAGWCSIRAPGLGTASSAASAHAGGTHSLAPGG